MADKTARVNFQSGGVASVLSAFRSITDALGVSSRKTAEFNREAVAGARSAASARLAAMKNTATAEQRANAESLAEQVKAFKDHAKAVKDLKENELRHFELAEKDKTKIALAEIRRRGNEEKAAAEKSAQLRKAIGNGWGSALSKGVGGTLNAAMGYGSAAMGLMGGFSIASAYGRANAFEDASRGLSNATYIPDLKDASGKLISAGTKRANVNDIMGVATEMQNQTGFDKVDLVKSWSTYVEKSSDSRAFTGKTPDERAAGKGFLASMARLAKGSGAQLSEIMEAAGMLKAQNENISSADMETTMLNIVGQGKLGAVSMADLAKHTSVITAQAGQFGMGQTDAQRSLLGLSQIAIQAAGSPAEAATATSHFVSDTMKHQGKLSAMGINVKDGSGKGLKDPAEIIRDVFKKTGGDMAKIGHLYGERGVRPFQALSSIYDSAERYKKGSGADAVYNKVIKAERMGYTKEEANADFKNAMGSRSERMGVAYRRIQDSVETALLPAFEKLASRLPDMVPKIEQFIDVAGKWIGWFIEHPMTGVGVALVAAVTKEVAAAALGTALNAAMKTSLGQQLGALAAVTVFAKTAEIAIQQAFEEKAKQDQDVFAADMASTNLANKVQNYLASGDVTAEGADKLKKELIEQQKADMKLASEKHSGGSVDQVADAIAPHLETAKTVAKFLLPGMSGITDRGVESLQDADRLRKRDQGFDTKTLEAQNEKLKALGAALDAATASAHKFGASKANPGDPSRNATPQRNGP